MNRDRTPANVPGPQPRPEPLPSPTPPLLILASDGDAVCVDDLCLPAEARP